MPTPTIFSPTITEAGQAAAFAADNDGLELKLTHVSFGLGHYDPTGFETALVEEVARVPIISGSRITPTQIRIAAVWSAASGHYPVGEVGYWAGDILFAVWSRQDGQVFGYKTPGLDLVVFNDMTLTQVPEGSVGIYIDDESDAVLAALIAHMGNDLAHPQYVLHKELPSAMVALWAANVGGTPNEIELTMANTVEVASYTVGLTIKFQAKDYNSGPVTIKVGDLDPIPVLQNGIEQLGPNSIAPDAIYEVTYDGANFHLSGGLGGGGGGMRMERFEHVANEGQTVFSAIYSPGSLMVFQNGREVGDDMFVATDGTTVTLLTEVEAGDKIVIVGFVSSGAGGGSGVSAALVQRAQELDWTYSGRHLLFEFFTPAYSMMDIPVPLVVLEALNGSDTITLSNTAGLIEGDTYVLTDMEDPPTVQQVVIDEILSGSQVKLTAALDADWPSTTRLARHSLRVFGAGSALARVGDVYLTGPIGIGNDEEGGAVIVRRSLNSGVVRLYFTDTAHSGSWVEVKWRTRRSGGKIPSGMADYEYIVPMVGTNGRLRLEFETAEVAVTHIAALDEATGLPGDGNPETIPTKPSILQPPDEETNVQATPTLQLSAYASPIGAAQAGAQFQISEYEIFEEIPLVLDTGTLPAALSYQVPSGTLEESKTYYVRGRYLDEFGQWSAWADHTEFTTADSFEYVETPEIISPDANATDVIETPTLASSGFSVYGGSDNHEASQWQIRSATGNYSAPVWDSGEDSTNLVSIIVPEGELEDGQTVYYCRVRHKGETLGWSAWSSEVRFTTREQFAKVIGLALIAEGGYHGTWARVDGEGQPITVDSSFFASHGTYGNIQVETIDGQEMVRIPKFYYKVGTITSGPYAGKTARWISDAPAAGFTLHPAFMNEGNEIDQFWVGAYLASTELDGSTLKATSLPNKPYVNEFYLLSRAKQICEARNGGGVTGFMCWDIYQVSAILMLVLIEVGTPNISRHGGAFGSLPSGNSHTSDAAPTAATWRGISGLWGCDEQVFDGLQVNNVGSVAHTLVFDKYGYREYVDTFPELSIVMRHNPSGVGNKGVYKVDDRSGTDFDLAPLFLPRVLSEIGTYSMTYVLSDEPDAYGFYFTIGGGSLFDLLSNGGSGDGTRLAKI